MTSIVDKYYRKISENIDNVKMKFDISALLVKSKEHDSLIDTNKNNISSNNSLIDTNKNNISSNTSLIDTNKNNISSNTSLIDTNKNNISINTSLIDTNKNNISSNTSLIDTNKNNISTLKTDVSNNYNFTQINKKKSDNNTTFIDTNRDNIVTNLSKINTHQTYIQSLNGKVFKLNDSYKLKDIIVFKITNNKSQAISKNKLSFVIFKDNIVYNFKKDSYIEVNLSIYLLFILHYINVQFFYVLLRVLNYQNELIKSIKMPLIGMISKQAIISNICYIELPNDYENINLELSIQIKENQNRNDIVKIIDFDNYLYCKIFEK